MHLLKITHDCYRIWLFYYIFQDLENYILELIPTLPQVFFLSLYTCTWAIIYIMLWKSVVVHHLVILITTVHHSVPHHITGWSVLSLQCWIFQKILNFTLFDGCAQYTILHNKQVSSICNFVIITACTEMLFVFWWCWVILSSQTTPFQ